MIFPLDVAGKIISFALNDSDCVEHRLCPFAQVNKVWYEASLSVLQNKTRDYAEKLINSMMGATGLNTFHPAIVEWSISIRAPYSCSTILDFRKEIEKRFEPLQELEPKDVRTMLNVATEKYHSFNTVCHIMERPIPKHLFFLGPIIDKNLEIVEAESILKSIRSLGDRAGSSEEVNRLRYDCVRLRYLRYHIEGAKIAATFLCEKDKELVITEYCAMCLDPEWRIDILAVAQILWPDQEKAHLILKKIARDFLVVYNYTEQYSLAFHLIDFLGGEKILVDLFSDIIKEFVEVNSLGRHLEAMKKIPDSSVRDQVLLCAVKAFLAKGNKSGIDFAKTITKHISGSIQKEANELIAKKEDLGCTIS